jgi:site-specific recombinase XerD
MNKRTRCDLHEWLDYNIANLATILRPGSIQLYRDSAKKFLSYMNEHWPNVHRPSQFRRDPHILGWMRSLCELKPPLANRTRSEVIIRVRRLIHDLEACSDPPRPNLFTSKDYPPLDRYLPKPLSPEDDRRLHQRMIERATLRSKALLILRTTGMRIGECRNLEVNSLRNLDRDQWAVRVPLGKLHSERWIPVDDFTRGIFESILSQRPFMPPSTDPGFLLMQKNGRIPSYLSLRHELIVAAREAGCSVQPAPHQLRHTFATDMLRAGASLPVVKTLLGHNSLDMTMRYVQVSQVDLQREYYKARAKSGEYHSLPKIIFDNLPNMCGLLSEASHAIEMYRRRSLNDKKKRTLARLINRISKILKELKLVEESID